RHTRFSRDWSSDVCSSDLGWTFNTAVEQDYVLSASQSNGICEHLKTVRVFSGKKPEALPTLASTYDLCKNEVKELKALEALPARSEERRVGKERRDERAQS